MLAQRDVAPGQRDLGTREVQGPRGAGLEVPGGPASLCFHKKKKKKKNQGRRISLVLQWRDLGHLPGQFRTTG